MSLPTPGSESSPPKRMRLGTKSCAECRRRRVRCIFTPGSRVCASCISHNTRCVPQQPKAQLQRQQPGVDSERADLHRRLEDLEAVVRKICAAIDLDADSATLAEFKVETLRRFSAPSSGNSVSSGISTGPPTISTPGVLDDEFDEDDEDSHFEDAPLLSLFKDAMRIEKGDIEPRNGQVHSTPAKIEACLQPLRSLLPGERDLMLILFATQPFWSLWPFSPTTNCGFDGRVVARDFMVDSLSSRAPSIVAKALLWLALCVQQLPRKFAYHEARLQGASSTLLTHYMASAGSLLAINSQSRGNTDALVCFLLQHKLYINMGKPRKAWLAVRHAMNIALLLGLQDPKRSVDAEPGAQWPRIWQADRVLSLILGLPPGIAEPHLSLSHEHAGDAIQEQLLHTICIVAGRTIQRNQNLKTATYSVTMELDQELEQCKSKMPSGWWDTASDLSLPLAVVYSRLTVKMFFYMVQKVIHLPYMLKSTSDRRFEISRVSALEGAREMIKCYEALRGRGELAHLICDLMDFQAFSAAIVIISDILTAPSQRNSQEEVSDWELVHGLIIHLHNVSQALECSVASQAAHLLERLSRCHDGDADSFEAFVPYFGRIRMQNLARSVLQTEQSRTTGVKGPVERAASTIEFNMDVFTSCTQLSTEGWLTEEELGIDWDSLVNVHKSYDWSQLSGMSPSQ